MTRAKAGKSGKKRVPAARGRSKPAKQQDIALERIRILFGLARDEFKRGNPDRSHRYVGLARRMGMRYNVKIPTILKRRLCGKCHRFLVPGKNCVVRSNSRTKAMEIRCLECKGVTRYPYARELSAKKAG